MNTIKLCEHCGKPLGPKTVQIDVRLDQVVLRALEKEPELRYQQASEVKNDIESVAGTVAIGPSQSQAMHSGYEYRSHQTLWGLPLLHIAYGLDLKTGKPRVASGIIAIGNIAKGVVALGGAAFGGLAFGGLSIGLLSVGGIAAGLVALGGGAVALLLAFGGAAVAPVALGGGAVGWFALGGGGWGVHAISGNVKDEVARGFFWRLGRQLVDLGPLHSLRCAHAHCIRGRNSDVVLERRHICWS